MIVQIIKLKSSMTHDEAIHTARKRASEFEKIPGLVQKYYVKGAEPGSYRGIYIWDSEESLASYRTSELAATIPSAYQLIEAPDIEIGEVIFQLRD